MSSDSNFLSGLVAKEDALLLTKVKDPDYRALPERIVVITIEALDWNCPQHIPQRLTVEEFDAQLKPIRIEMAQLRAENEALRESIETYLTDAAMGPEHFSVNWERTFTELLANHTGGS